MIQGAKESIKRRWGGVVGVSGRDKCGCGVKGPILVTCKWYTWRGCKKGLVLGPIR